MDVFLKAKHWQLFLLTFGLPLVLQLVLMLLLLSGGIDNPDPRLLIGYMKFFPLVMLLTIGVLFGWLWAVAVGLQRKVPPHILLPVKLFKTLFFISGVYVLLLLAMVEVYFTGRLPEAQLPDVWLATALFPLHLLVMLAMFYCLHFAARTFKTVALQREVSFNEFAGEFFMIWLFPFGIWILQPKINRLVAA